MKQAIQILCAIGLCVLFGVVTITGDYISAFEETIPVFLETSNQTEESLTASGETPALPGTRRQKDRSNRRSASHYGRRRVRLGRQPKYLQRPFVGVRILAK